MRKPATFLFFFGWVGSLPWCVDFLELQRQGFSLGCTGSLVGVCGLSCSAAGGILAPQPGIEPHPLHWKVDSFPLDHGGSPTTALFWFWAETLLSWRMRKRETAWAAESAPETLVKGTVNVLRAVLLLARRIPRRAKFMLSMVRDKFNGISVPRQL